MSKITIPKPIDHQAAFAAALARMRTATTHEALDKAIAKVDLASAAILSAHVMTMADADFRRRAQEWVQDRTRNVVQADNAISNMAMYRERRVGPDRPYARKATTL